MTNRIATIAADTTTERDEYLEEIGWEYNPFAHPATIDEYVVPSEGEIADIASALQDYTGPILIHSRYSGVGKTTLLSMLMESFGEDYTTIRIGEHNVSAYELAGIIADELGPGKSSTTKYSEAKIRTALDDAEQPLLLGIDEFGLNEPETLHVVQNINDHPNARVILTGMTSQWEAIGKIGSEGRAFRRRVGHEVELEPFTLGQSKELVGRRVAGAVGRDYDVDPPVPLGPIQPESIEVAHNRSGGVPAVLTAAFNTMVGFAAYRYRETHNAKIDADLAEQIDYADPLADPRQDDVEPTAGNTQEN